MRSFKLPVLVLFASFSINSIAQTTKVDVQKGQKFMVEVSSKVNSSAEVMGQTMENNVDSKSHTVYEIVKSESDGIKLHSTITKLQVNASAMGQEMSFDSDKQNNEGPIAEMLSPKINKPRSIVLDTKGTIVKQDEVEENPQGAMMGLGDANATTTDLFIPALVDRKLESGDSFTDVSSVKKDKYSSRDSGTYKITAIENGVASISYTGTQVVAAIMEQMGMEMTSNSNNTVKSEMQVDLRTGLVLAKATVIEATVSIDAAGMMIPATGKTIITAKLTPAN